jgi:hypothetical protein
MTTLTRAELAHYPGETATDRALSHHREAPIAPRRAKALGLGAPRAAQGALSLPRRLDLRPFPGRDRTERVMGWLIAHIPNAASWSQESLREMAARIAAKSETVE